MQKSAKRRLVFLAIALAIAGLLGLAGCADDPATTQTQQLPWDRPASWEGGMPGMGGQAPKY